MRANLIVGTAIGLALTACSSGGNEPEGKPGEFRIMSQAFSDGDVMPVEFTCDGDSISPPLRWVGPPAGTKSYVLTMTDLDAPSGSFRHWGAYDIPSDRRYVKAGDGLPNAGNFNQVLNGKGQRDYFAPCPIPGSGPHRYVFKVIALGKPMLEVGEDTTVGGLEEAAAGSKLGEAEFTLTYERK